MFSVLLLSGLKLQRICCFLEVGDGSLVLLGSDVDSIDVVFGLNDGWGDLSTLPILLYLGGFSILLDLGGLPVLLDLDLSGLSILLNLGTFAVLFDLGTFTILLHLCTLAIFLDLGVLLLQGLVDIVALWFEVG